MNSKQPFSNQDHIVLELLLTLLVFFMLLFSAGHSKLLANESPRMQFNEVELQLEISKTIISENSYIGIKYHIINHSMKDMNEFEIKSGLHRFRSNHQVELEVFSSNESQQKIRIPAGDTLSLYSEAFVPFEIATAWIINAGVKVELEEHVVYVGAAKMIYGFGVNMDINAGDECIGLNELREVELISRLLIDEDAAKDPGITMINVGGFDIEIVLPKTQWEARNIMISCSELNANVEFDPFDLPPDLELDILCDQDGSDLGRNTDNVLDECEPIETFRDLCSSMGEDDVLCEFPEWVFCYHFRIPESYEEDTYTIDATDDYEVWQAIENPAGSGNFDPFVDVTNDISSGNSDQVILTVKTVLPVSLIDAKIEVIGNEVVFDWQTSNEINNSHYEIYKSHNGMEFVKLADVLANSASEFINSYQFIDKSPFDGDNYYQLVQKDLNGQTSHLVTKYVYVDESIRPKSVFPNPVSDRIFIEAKDQFHQYELYDQNSHLVSKGQILENNILVSDVGSGIYLLMLSNTDHSRSHAQKIIVSQ